MGQEQLYIIMTGVITLIVVGSIILYLSNSKLKKSKEILSNTKKESQKLVDETLRQAEAMKKEAILEAKDVVHRERVEADKEFRERRNEVVRLENRTFQKEEAIDRKIEELEKKEELMNRKAQSVQDKESLANQLIEEREKELVRISNLTKEDAREIILSDVHDSMERELTLMIRDMEAKAKDEANKKAKEIITSSIQRIAADHVSETTVHVVSLPNDEMKGRIIGREGRNIRTLEALTGVDLIIDDTPEAVILSSFDPIRREIAKITLEKLILDGRIHPARIEEMLDKAKDEIEETIKEEGEQASFELDIHGIHPELIKLLGSLKFRTSYGQNVLKHSIEVANLAGLMAAELGLDIKLAKRAGLLHDIGKAVDHEVEGPHALIGSNLAKRYNESPLVVNAIGAHHGDVEMKSLEAVIVQSADAVSAARPGARRETLENYIKRLENLEEIANSYEGVEKSYAIQAGREIRIIVKPDQVDDVEAMAMARKIVKQIEEEMEYPGQIKINVIRETRSVDYAK